MPLTPSFSVSQPIGKNNTVTITDTSTGSDPLVISRKLYLRKSDGTYITLGGATDYIPWSIAVASIDIDTLDKDYALRITVEWLRVSNVQYSEFNIYGLTAYNEDFDYQLTSVLCSNQLLVNDNHFLDSKSELRLLIDAGNQAIETAGDLTSAQLCYDQATDLRVNSQYYFNSIQS
jgi:hypothetical protein